MKQLSFKLLFFVVYVKTYSYLCAMEKINIIKKNVNFQLYKSNDKYFLERIKDGSIVEVDKDKVEDYVLWGNLEFKKECELVEFE